MTDVARFTTASLIVDASAYSPAETPAVADMVVVTGGSFCDAAPWLCAKSVRNSAETAPIAATLDSRGRHQTADGAGHLMCVYSTDRSTPRHNGVAVVAKIGRAHV